jgi:hypothetical protein
MNRFVVGSVHRPEAGGVSSGCWAGSGVAGPAVRPARRGFGSIGAHRSLAAALLVGLLASACGSSGATATPTPAGGGGGGSGAPTSGAPASAATAAPGGGSSGDPCALLTQAEVSAAVGAAVGAGTPSGSRGCAWQSPATGLPSEQATFTIDVGTPFAGLCGGTSNAAAGITITQLSGIGDGACYSAIVGLGASRNITFEKNGQAYTVAVVLPVGASDAAIQAADKTLALNALGRL